MKNGDKRSEKEKSSCYLRKASLDDAFCLYCWKNDKESLKNSRNPRPVDWGEHVEWLKNSLNSSDRILWILEKEGEKLGTLRFDYLDTLQNGIKVAEISYAIAREHRGKGYGRRILLLAQEQAAVLGIGQLYAEVLLHNEASRKLFLKLGYREKKQEVGYSYRKAVGTIFFRVDMNEEIATGHVMRCLSIADAAAEKGIKSLFITADEEPVNLLKERGYDSLVLFSGWRKMEEELPILKEVIFQFGIERLLVDSYQVTSGYLSVLQTMTEVFYMDDLDSFPYPVQNIICYADYYSTLSYGKKKDMPGYYLGTGYMPLGRGFQNREPKIIGERINSVLLMSGGSDPHNMLQRILDRFLKEFRGEEDFKDDKNKFCENTDTSYKAELSEAADLNYKAGLSEAGDLNYKAGKAGERRKELIIRVICGSLYPNFPALVKKYEKEAGLSGGKGKLKIEFYQNVGNIQDYMKITDLAISAGGTTLYELAAMGVPTITFSFVQNQLKNVYQFAEDDLMDYAGDASSDSVEDEIIRLYTEAEKNFWLRKKRSIRMQQLVDGRGAERIAALLSRG